jgi:phosphoglucosamine mutase
MSIRFGTDGVRGVANEQITAEVALAIGRATARVFPSSHVVIGRDTRRSGAMLAAGVAAGVAAEGADAVQLGVVPTPAVALVAAQDDVPGVVISASHNPFGDNGLKVFAPGGRKLGDDQQDAVEAAIAEVLDGAVPSVSGAAVGGVRSVDDALARYGAAVATVLDGRDLAGLRLVVDCANGANSTVAPQLLADLGAQVTVLCAEPDGTNINDGCGSTHPELLQEAVVREGADLGIAFDGDADRLLAVDHRGRVVDGDQIIALFATDLAARERLANRTVVVTVMSNLGFHRAMRAAGIDVVQTPVGDRHVLEALATGGFSLGGEQSGHIVLSDWSTTGDGLLAALTLVDLVRRHDRPLAELADGAMTAVPQVLVNVRIEAPMPDAAQRLSAPIGAASQRLGEDGRVLVRPSGTEPVVRVMVEATDPAEADAVAAELADAVRAEAARPQQW